MKLEIVLGLVLGACAGLGAQASGQGLGYLHAQVWSTEDGLPQNSVHRTLQTRDGYIWIATESGVARFDGVNFRTFDHANERAFVSDDTCCLAEDAAGDLWIGTADGLLRLQRGEFRRFEERDGLPSATIEAVIALQGRPVLALAAGRLVEWRGDRFVAVAGVPAGLRGVQASGGQLVWLKADGSAQLAGGGLVRMQGGQSGQVEGVERTADGTVWSFSSTTLTAVRGGLTRVWRVGRELPGRRVESLYVDREGMAWVGTNEGLAAVSAATGAALAEESLKGSSVLQTMQDKEGNYWVGTDASGLHILRRLKFRTEPGVTTQATTSVVQSDGAVWLGTRNDGLVRVSHGRVDEPAAVEKLSSPIILSLAPAGQGGIWAGTPDGLNNVSADGTVRQVSSADGLPDDSIQALAAGRDDSIWIGTRHGLVHLARLDGGAPKMEVLTTRDGLPGDLVGALLVSGEDLYVATSGGLCRRTADGKWTTIVQESGAASGVVTAMARVAGGRLWAARQDGGLSWLDGGILRRVAGFVAAGMIDGMIADGEGYLWLRGRQGIERVRLAALERCTAVANNCRVDVEPFGVADGLATEQVVASGSPVMARIADGELWFATRRGVAIADPAHVSFNSVVPPVVLQRFLVDETPFGIDDRPVVIGPGHVRYTMEFAALSFTQPGKVRYRYRLEGLEKSWTDGGNRRSATYTNLPPGSFTFRVQAMNNDGVWNEAGASLRFRVVPPIYRRPWFYALCLMALGAIAALLYRLRLRRLQRGFDAVLEERNRVAREIHDTLAQDFVGVSLQLDIVSRLLAGGKVEAALAQVADTRELVTDGLADARSSIWLLRANLAQDSLPTRLEKLALRYSGEALKVKLRVGGAFRAIEASVEEEVLRVAQESLSNVQRHSGAATASVELLYGEDMLVLTVEDAGRGFNPDQSSKLEGHYGLSGMRERAALCGGTLQIASATGEGTRVVLRVQGLGLGTRD